MFEYKSRGFIVFTVTGGVVEDEALELIRDRDSAVRKMTAIIDDAKKHDACADPNQRRYARDIEMEYGEKYKKAGNLCSVTLNSEDDLKIIEIFEMVPIPFYVSRFRGIVTLFNALSGKIKHVISRMSWLSRFRH